MKKTSPEVEISDGTSEKIKRATVSFTQKDLERIEKLKEALDIVSTSQTISMAIKIADAIREQKAQGNDIIFEKDDKQKEMIIPGL